MEVLRALVRCNASLGRRRDGISLMRRSRKSQEPKRGERQEREQDALERPGVPQRDGTDPRRIERPNDLPMHNEDCTPIPIFHLPAPRRTIGEPPDDRGVDDEPEPYRSYPPR